MSQILSLHELPLKNQKVLLRVDFNVPLNEKGEVTDDSRIRAALPTIRYLLEKGCAIILMSHLGRPDGKVVSKCSLKPVARRLSELLKKDVEVAPDCIGETVRELAQKLESGELLMLENLRFHSAEEKPEKDLGFARELATLGDYYVDDAFGCAHRAHASIVDLPKLFPKRAAMGLLFEKEVLFLGERLKKPPRPFLAIIGGAKISTKIGVLRALVDKVDLLLIGGGMAFTFLVALGRSVGGSLVEMDLVEEAKHIIDLCREKKVELLLPVDVIAAKKVSATKEETQLIDIAQGIPDGWIGFDIGPKTVESFKGAIQRGKTILWNGPMGVFENPSFAKGTALVAEAVALSGALTIAGGGETIAALQATPWSDRISHLSTGGGATLEYIEYGTLPGIEALRIP